MTVAIVCPFAQWRPLPEAESQPRITPRTVIFHTMVGNLRGTERFFKESTGVESHFGIGGPWDGPDLDGAIWQWMSLDRQADANLDANSFAISIETSDNAPLKAADLAAWSPKQQAALIRLGRWLADTFDIPRRQCRTWLDGGFGWHAMWGAPSHWTPAVGKVCPGAARIAQLKTVVFPAIFADTQEGLTMADAQTILDELKRMRQDLTVFGTTGLEETVENIASRQRETLTKLDAIGARVAAIESDVDRLVGS